MRIDVVSFFPINLNLKLPLDDLLDPSIFVTAEYLELFDVAVVSHLLLELRDSLLRIQSHIVLLVGARWYPQLRWVVC